MTDHEAPKAQAVTRVSVIDDLGHEISTGLSRRKWDAIKMAIHHTHHRIAPDEIDFRKNAVETVRQLIHNAVSFVHQNSSAFPWSFVAVREGSELTWTISDEGPGILAHYMESCAGKQYPIKDEERTDTLLVLLNERGTSMAGDPNAGLGTVLAIKAATDWGMDVTLATDGMRLSMKDGAMRIDGTDDTIKGTTWTVRIPLGLRKPRPIEASAPGSTMKRPTRNDQDIVRAAAEKIAAACVEWDPTSKPEDWVEALLKERHDWRDGYALARQLERYSHVLPDADLVEVLSEADYLLDEEVKKAVRTWVKIVGFDPAHAVGDRVTSRHGIGVVNEVVMDLAQYVVSTDGEKQGGWVLSAADVSAAPELEPQ